MPLSEQAIFYRPSGRISVTAPLHLFAATPLCIILGTLYAAIIHYNPFIWFSFFGTVGFGFLVGYTADRALRAGRSRALTFNLLGATLLAVFAWWVSWLVWIALTFDRGTEIALEWMMSPPTRWGEHAAWLTTHIHETVSRYAGAGTPSAPATPTELTLQWIGEAVLVIGTAVLSVLASAEDNFYSELTGRWARSMLKCEVLGLQGTVDELRSALKQHNFSYLTTCHP
ncbi:hypothetical protein [Burkholderia sp. LMG 32019]|uniref:hypothetical protein n=1 Tax=Burkholderia sp. LMG 32019 TaxID=3158173 RepID=UPI003C302E1C